MAGLPQYCKISLKNAIPPVQLKLKYGGTGNLNIYGSYRDKEPSCHSNQF